MWWSVALAHPVSDAASAFVEELDEPQRDAASWTFDDDERHDLRLAPLGLEGLPVRDMTELQRQRLNGLLGQVLSNTGLVAVHTIMELEDQVREAERGTVLRVMRRLRDPELYWFALFGQPGESMWGFRFDGHHVSVNLTQVGDEVRSTPLFLGAQPQQLFDGEEEAARRLVARLRPGQTAVAGLPFQNRRGNFLGSEAFLDLDAPVGLPYENMTEEQQRLTQGLVTTFLDRMVYPPQASWDSLHFAWAEDGDRCYFRFHSDTLLIEYDDTVSDHVHTIVRDLDGDWGQDLLRQHHAEAHRDG